MAFQRLLDGFVTEDDQSVGAFVVEPPGALILAGLEVDLVVIAGSCESKTWLKTGVDHGHASAIRPFDGVGSTHQPSVCGFHAVVGIQAFVRSAFGLRKTVDGGAGFNPLQRPQHSKVMVPTGGMHLASGPFELVQNPYRFMGRPSLGEQVTDRNDPSGGGGFRQMFQQFPQFQSAPVNVADDGGFRG